VKYSRKQQELNDKYGIEKYPPCEKCNGETRFHSELAIKHGQAVSLRFRCTECGGTDSMFIDLETIKHSVRLQKSNQKLMDSNRIERKSVREHNRIVNALEEYNKNIIDILKSYDLGKKTILHSYTSSGGVGLLQLADLHLNELVSMAHNQFDFNIASIRLYEFVSKAIIYFKALDIKSVVIASTGDLMNSDRRLDELLNQATNRSNATILSVHLIKQVIEHLNKHFNVSYACVTGNESRIPKDVGWSDIIATDNYDFSIFNMLRYLFVGSNVKFILGDPTELVVNLAGQNVLLIHGHGKQMKRKTDESVAQIKGKYADIGIIIHYILTAHNHTTLIGDGFSRSSSLVGDNDFSFKGLQVTGRAGQNIHVFFENGNRDSIKIDLQNIGKKGYDVINELEAYNSKSHDKLSTKKTIFEVRI
jgi:hypothetical protein